MLIYVSGPYSLGNISDNIRQACFAGDKLLEMGHYPIVPHLTHLWHLISPKSWEDWMRIDSAIIPRCDALLKLPKILKR